MTEKEMETNLLYGVRVATLFLLRAMQKDIVFNLALYMADIGRFGDIVFKVLTSEGKVKKTYFIYLKPSNIKKKNLEQFGDFYEKFQKKQCTKEHLESCGDFELLRFIIYSTGTVDDDVAISECVDPLACVFTSSPEVTGSVYLSREESHKPGSLLLFTEQATLNTVNTLIKTEVEKIFHKSNALSRQWILSLINEKMEDWSAEDPSPYMSTKHFKTLLSELECKVYADMTGIMSHSALTDLIIYSVRDLRSTMQQNKGVLVVECGIIGTKTVSFYIQCFLSSDSFIIVESVALASCWHEVICTWERGGAHLLLIEGEIGNEMEKSVYEELCQILKKNDSKRLVIICSVQACNTLATHLKHQLGEKFSTFDLMKSDCEYKQRELETNLKLKEQMDHDSKQKVMEWLAEKTKFSDASSTSSGFVSGKLKSDNDMHSRIDMGTEQLRQDMLEGFEEQLEVNRQQANKQLEQELLRARLPFKKDLSFGTQHYKKTFGMSDFSGASYEVKMAALLFVRGNTRTQKFYLASNVKGAGVFDDIVFKLGHKTIFIQLKHFKHKRKVPFSQRAQRKGAFDLEKFYTSYCNIKQQWTQDRDLHHLGKFEDALFIVYTNTEVDIVKYDVGDVEWQNILMTGGKCFRFTDNSCPVKELSHCREFLSKLWFFTEQASESQLDFLIRQEIKALCGTDKVYVQYWNEIQNWWRDSNEYLTEDAELWKNILKETKEPRIKFNEEEVNRIRTLFKSPVKILKFVACRSSRLTFLKIEQSLTGNVLLVEDGTLQTEWNIVQALWSKGYNVLVMMDLTIDKNVEQITPYLQHTLHLYPEKQLVLIGDDTSLVMEKLCNDFNLLTYRDVFTFSQLDPESQSKVLDCKINFQGRPASIGSIADSTVLEALTADCLDKLLQGEMTIGQELFYQDDFYVSRRFFRREQLDKRIFHTRESKRLALSGISQQELQQLVPPDKDEQSQCEYLFISGVSDFMELCREYETIHWVHREGENFMWKHSKGDMAFITSHLVQDGDPVEYVGVREVMQFPHQIVLLVAEPGMGKSTELSHLISEVKGADPTTWVIRVDLINHTESLYHDDKPNALKLLSRAGVFNTDFERTLFEHEIKTRGNVIVMFDGFDEVCPVFEEKVVHVFRQLASTEFMIKKLLVTSRPHLREKLVDELHSLPFELSPFSQSEQELFFLQYWDRVTNENYILNSFIKVLLLLTESSANDSSCSNPLQARILAEVFSTEAEYFCETGEIRLPAKLDLLQLYNMFIDKKFEIYFQKNNTDITKPGLLSVYKDMKDVLKENLTSCALLAVLDRDEVEKLHNSEIIIKNCNQYLRMVKQGHEKIGIVVGVMNDRPVFVHRIFEEYFFSLWFSENYVSNRNFLQEKIFEPNFQVVRIIFNRILCQDFQLHTAVMNLDKLAVETLLSEEHLDVNALDKGGRSALHLAVMNFIDVEDGDSDSVMKIIKILLDHKADISVKDSVLLWTPLQIAERIKAWTVVDLLQKTVS